MKNITATNRNHHLLGFTQQGEGLQRVIVLNDWLGDVSTWDGVRPYLNNEQLTWVFADLRGYGRSRGQHGDFTVVEAATDVLALATSLGWSRFSIVGHSMSSLVALHLAQHHADSIERIAVLTPPPPRGFAADDVTLNALRDVAYGDDDKRMSMAESMWGNRLSKQWQRFKVARWRACSDVEAVAAYVYLFARDGLPNPTIKITSPLLAITGEQDADVMREQAVTAALRPITEDLRVVPLLSSGHYPMQEVPPLFAAVLERFLIG